MTLFKKITIAIIAPLIFLSSGLIKADSPSITPVDSVVAAYTSNKPHNKSSRLKKNAVPAKPVKKELTLKALSPNEEKIILAELFQETGLISEKESLFDKESIKKLNIISGPDGMAQGALSSIFPTQTVLGSLMTQFALAMPATELAEIKNNQALTKFFTTNHAAAEKAHHAFAKIAEGEALGLSWFDEIDELEKNTTQSLYFSLLSKKRASTLLAVHTMRRLNRFSPAPAEEMIAAYIPAIAADALRFIFKVDLSELKIKFAQFLKENVNVTMGESLLVGEAEMPLVPKDSLWKKYLYGIPLDKIIRPVYTTYQIHRLTPTTDIPSMGTMYNFAVSQGYSRPVAALSATLLPLLNDFGLFMKYKFAYDTTKFEEQVLAHIHKRLKAAACVVEGLHLLAEIANEYQEFVALLPETKNLIELFETGKEKKEDLEELVRLLQTNTLKSDYAFLSHSGNILAAYTLMQELADEFIPALYAAGKIEGFVAAANLVTNYTAQRGVYTFVDFVESEHPLLCIAQGRNPLMCTAENAVENTILLGSDAQVNKNLLITGPNGSGKSVLMAMFPLVITTAQAYGITSAHETVMTPFRKVIVSANVVENLQQNKSTFMAQQQRFNDVIFKACLENENKNFSLVLLDEALSGTSDDVGGPMVFEGGKKLAELENTITIMASHFTQPSELEETTNGAFSSYYLDVEVANGEIKRLFTLKRGKNPWWKIDQTMTEAYVRALAQEN